MTIDVRIEILVEVEQVRKDQPKWFLAEEGRAGILECPRGDKELPTVVAITPAQLAAFHVFKSPFPCRGCPRGHRRNSRRFQLHHLLPSMANRDPA